MPNQKICPRSHYIWRVTSEALVLVHFLSAACWTFLSCHVPLRKQLLCVPNLIWAWRLHHTLLYISQTVMCACRHALHILPGYKLLKEKHKTAHCWDISLYYACSTIWASANLKLALNPYGKQLLSYAVNVKCKCGQLWWWRGPLYFHIHSRGPQCSQK